jgi:hypothetical protein
MYPCYRFPKREACLMAMSYSYEIQAGWHYDFQPTKSKPVGIDKPYPDRYALVQPSRLSKESHTMRTTTNTAKTGIAINQVTGHADWFLVEYSDGTASVHPTWDEAFTAGQFATDEVTQ